MYKTVFEEELSYRLMENSLFAASYLFFTSNNPLRETEPDFYFIGTSLVRDAVKIDIGVIKGLSLYWTTFNSDNKISHRKASFHHISVIESIVTDEYYKLSVYGTEGLFLELLAHSHNDKRKLREFTSKLHLRFDEIIRKSSNI